MRGKSAGKSVNLYFKFGLIQCMTYMIVDVDLTHLGKDKEQDIKEVLIQIYVDSDALPLFTNSIRQTYQKKI